MNEQHFTGEITDGIRFEERLDYQRQDEEERQQKIIEALDSLNNVIFYKEYVENLNFIARELGVNWKAKLPVNWASTNGVNWKAK
jgi:hypothetical protein